MGKKSEELKAPESMKVLLSRLFGIDSSIVKNDYKTKNEWKTVLKKIIKELENYIEDNIESDELHKLMFYFTLSSMEESLKEDNFWIGFIEGLTRLTLLLIGDSPNHKRRNSGRKKRDHYKLNLFRSIQYHQNYDQKFRTMFAVSNLRILEIKKDPQEALMEFRLKYGSKADYKSFVKWYKLQYPDDYSKIF